jgi:lipopolysaccharide/colanic/teichoic acid biosynthesis glycosyltransferase
MNHAWIRNSRWVLPKGKVSPALSPTRGDDLASGARDSRLLLKDVLDRLVAALLLLLLLVWLVLISAAIWLDSPGPIFERHPRLGRHGRRFELLRFRSTVLGLPLDGAGPTQPDGDAVRRVRTVTRVGPILRRYYLDELPQLINVLRGDMSFVGPRPQHPRAAVEQQSVPSAPLPVKPGLTGLCCGDGGSGCAGPVDVEAYLRNYSVGLDLSILRHSLRSRVDERRGRLTGGVG